MLCPGRETTEPVEVPPDFNVIVPPEEFSDALCDALSVNANAPERVRLPAPVSRAIPDKVRLSFTFR